MTHRLLDGSQDAALDVSNGFCVNRGQLMHQTVVERQQGQVEEEALSYCVLSPWCSNLCGTRIKIKKIQKSQLEGVKEGRCLMQG